MLNHTKKNAKYLILNKNDCQIEFILVLKECRNNDPPTKISMTLSTK